MTQASDPPRHSQRVAIVLTVLVGVIATAVAYLGTRENPQAPVSPSAAPAGTTLPVQTIVLPQDEPELPPGPASTDFRHLLHDLPLDAAGDDATAVPPEGVGGGGSQDGQDLRRPDRPRGGGADRGLPHDGPGQVTGSAQEPRRARSAAEGHCMSADEASPP